ncbi:hypothetical protein GGR57DRAFT_152602 [Xylariaceae sp. FL1272]|nr:hypothetical protein GGR57DRAFT_152602 [Xylariaceae sp. FL1272]
MADPGGAASQHGHAPLTDSTDRVNNASPNKSDKKTRSRQDQLQPNPLRHRSSGIPAHMRAHSASSSQVPKPVETTIPIRSNPKVAQGHPDRNSVGDDASDKRVSQLSVSTASSARRKTHIGPWQLGKTLGTGSAARVRLARHYLTQEMVAVKILARNSTQITAAGSIADLDQWDRSRNEYQAQGYIPMAIEREVAILKLIDHPNIVKLYDIWENRSEIYMVLEYMDYGDFFSYISRVGALPEYEMMGYFRQLLDALEYCHSFKICHRDLKPENILMQSNGIVKIADFGMAAIQQSPTHGLRTSCGSPHYAAPELINRHVYEVDKVDIWSLGCILYAALCGRLPFDDPTGNIPRLLGKAARGEYVIPSHLSQGIQDLIRRMLEVDAIKRIPIRIIWRHPIVRKYDEMDDLNTRARRSVRFSYDERRTRVPLEEIDSLLLRQLRSILHTYSEKQLKLLLTSSEPNDQKMYYWLLVHHQETRMESYDASLAYSPSDIHHFRPTTMKWKQQQTTSEFLSQDGRLPSKFTLVSNTEASIGGTEKTASKATLQSYDPYKSSRVMVDKEASHAKIIIHRGGSSAKNSTRSSVVHRAQSGSARTNSTHSNGGKGARYLTPSAAMRASRRSLGSIQSSGAGSYTRPISRHKRGVDFSQSRGQLGVPRDVSRPPITPMRHGNLSKHSNGKGKGKGKSNGQPMADASYQRQGSTKMTEEMREFSYSIAKDCDDAFNSSLPDGAESYLDVSTLDNHCDGVISSPVGMSTPSPAAFEANQATRAVRPWDSRPLPPAPDEAHEMLMAEKRASRKENHHGSSVNVDCVSSHLNCLVPNRTSSAVAEKNNQRAVSAPIYSAYSTQWGKGKMPLPPINERSKEELRGEPSDKRIVSAPARYMRKTNSGEVNEFAGLEYLAQQERTIRIVDSPSNNRKVDPSLVPAPLNLNTQRPLTRGAHAGPAHTQQRNLRERYVHDEAELPTPAEEPDTSTATKRNSWYRFKRSSRDGLFSSKASASNSTDRLTHSDTSSSDGAAHTTLKKAFGGLAFWRRNRNQSQMEFSIGPDAERSPSPQPVRVYSQPAQHPHQSDASKNGTDVKERRIEAQQHWIFRLLRVKPATHNVCFSMSARQARQEIALLLKDWRKYGIEDVQVDKQRNMIFARVGPENYRNAKEVSFAAEIMDVIEHRPRGRNLRLSVVRFTQERGAASSFHHVVNMLTSTFEDRNLLIKDKYKTKMILKTLSFVRKD